MPDQPTQGPATPAVWLWSETLRDANAGSIVLPDAQAFQEVIMAWWMLVAGMAGRDGRAELEDARCCCVGCSLLVHRMVHEMGNGSKIIDSIDAATSHWVLMIILMVNELYMIYQHLFSTYVL